MLRARRQVHPPRARCSRAGWPASGLPPAQRRACCCHLPPRLPCSIYGARCKVSQCEVSSQHGTGCRTWCPWPPEAAYMHGTGTGGGREGNGEEAWLLGGLAKREAPRPPGAKLRPCWQRSPDVWGDKVALPVRPLKRADQLWVCCRAKRDKREVGTNSRLRRAAQGLHRCGRLPRAHAWCWEPGAAWLWQWMHHQTPAPTPPPSPRATW